MEKLKASIIIPTKDKLSRLLLVLKVIERQVSEDIEVIIVFDGCLPETLINFKKHHFAINLTTIICKENVGRAAARNRGITAARGEVVIFLDDDRIPGVDFIALHLKWEHNDNVILGERRTIVLTEPEIEDMYLREINDIYMILNNKSFIDPDDTISNLTRRIFYPLKSPLRWMRFFTGNVSILRKNLLDVGCFDENYKVWGYEDRDLGYQLSKKGLRFIEDIGIINYHIFHQYNTVDKYNNSILNLRYMIKKIKNDTAIFIFLKIILFITILKKFIYEMQEKYSK